MITHESQGRERARERKRFARYKWPRMGPVPLDLTTVSQCWPEALMLRSSGGPPVFVIHRENAAHSGMDAPRSCPANRHWLMLRVQRTIERVSSRCSAGNRSAAAVTESGNKNPICYRSILLPPSHNVRRFFSVKKRLTFWDRVVCFNITISLPRMYCQNLMKQMDTTLNMFPTPSENLLKIKHGIIPPTEHHTNKSSRKGANENSHQNGISFIWKSFQKKGVSIISNRT